MKCDVFTANLNLVCLGLVRKKSAFEDVLKKFGLPLFILDFFFLWLKPSWSQQRETSHMVCHLRVCNVSP